MNQLAVLKSNQIPEAPAELITQRHAKSVYWLGSSIYVHSCMEHNRCILRETRKLSSILQWQKVLLYLTQSSVESDLYWLANGVKGQCGAVA